MVSSVTEVGTAVGHILAGFFIVLFSTYFFLADGTGSGPGWSGSRRAPRASGSTASGRVAWILADPVRAGHRVVAATDAIG